MKKTFEEVSEYFKSLQERYQDLKFDNSGVVCDLMRESSSGFDALFSIASMVFLRKDFFDENQELVEEKLSSLEKRIKAIEELIDNHKN